MKFLLDTHVLLWALARDEKLPENVRNAINNPDNEIYYSAVSVWEVTIKNMKNPKIMPVSGEALAKYCDQSGYRRLPLRNEHIYLLPSLKRAEDAPEHHDPFDRILICQAKAENMTFITHDALIPYYHEPCVMSI